MIYYYSKNSTYYTCTHDTKNKYHPTTSGNKNNLIYNKDSSLQINIKKYIPNIKKDLS